MSTIQGEKLVHVTWLVLGQTLATPNDIIIFSPLMHGHISLTVYPHNYSLNCLCMFYSNIELGPSQNLMSNLQPVQWMFACAYVYWV